MTELDTDLAAQVLHLQERHRELDAEIAHLEAFPYQDQLHLRRLKKEKLRLKETIERLRTMLIPDLDA
ncbi:MAG TPA: YdcH family protein [Spongiibacteraceae bacterium]|nr:YdcH family protein [Spongiibacteraceae bacterium]